MFTAKNENELLQLLKIVSEEAVGAAKRKLKETSDPRSQNFKKRLDATPFSLKEEEEKEEEAGAEQTTDATPSSKSEEDVPDNFGASIDSLQKNINALRAGKSLKDSTVKKQLEVYYDKLTEEERKVLVLFLRELSRILSGNVSGDDAVDPSDPPPGLNIDFVAKNKQQAEPAQQTKTQQPAQQKQPQRVTTGDTEDTTPPIRVNEVQDYSKLRQKLKNLFRD